MKRALTLLRFVLSVAFGAIGWTIVFIGAPFVFVACSLASCSSAVFVYDAGDVIAAAFVALAVIGWAIGGKR